MASDTAGGDAGEDHDQLMMLDTPIRKMIMPVISALSRKILGSSLSPDGLVKEDGQDHAVYHGYHAFLRWP